MAENPVKWLFLILASCLCFAFVLSESNLLIKKTYIVQMHKSAMPASFSSPLEWYSSKLKSVMSDTQSEGEGDGENRIIYSYQNAFHGVAAQLTEEEAERLKQEDGVVAILPETKYELHTTRSPMFLGLEPEESTSIWSQKLADHDVIVGVLDTGIWPESASFNDTGMTPVPAHWKGTCETGRGFQKHHCNRKIVGARVFYRGYEAATGKINEKNEYKSPRDQDGHGTHTAATVAGSPVRGANLLGYAYGTARGMAPGARIAAYKVCWTGGCFSSDILSAVDRAVGDGMEGKAIKHYALTNGKPTATLAFLGTRLGVRPSPVVAAFSSRGPNFLTLEILKPDVVAPGVNILAAWTGELGPSSLPTDHRRVRFNILSGTSMSCPHVSGIAALIKARHPDWSPAAVKSALMTTAYVHDNIHNPLQDSSTAAASTPYDHGAGHINPLKALDPGLIYDISAQDYFEFLCTQKLTAMQLKAFSKHSNMSCHHNTLATPGDLNYPAISVVFPEDTAISTLTLHRTVTNVGPPASHYHVVVSPFKGVTIKVEPKTLNFTRRNQKLSYKISFTRKSPQTMPEFGGLAWKDGVHKVRSPIAITWLPPF
uniref:Subtilisin-like protease n=1 Tax=Gossypium raimondii TaxID=29730 RepID=A0A0D2Q4I6_GOSRA|nr:hypothetical protein B456_006G065800 [Gossypium raimondii]